MLDRNRHPFHRHAEVAYFLAERDGEPIERIAAIVALYIGRRRKS